LNSSDRRLGRWFFALPEVVRVSQNQFAVGIDIPVELRRCAPGLLKEMLRERGFANLSRSGDETRLPFFGQESFNFGGEVTHIYIGRKLS
jgi:hypothetical protein